MAKTVVVFDMDGVLVEVTQSYLDSIVHTVRHFTGETVTHRLIQEYKNAGGWNNDWMLSQKIARDLGVEIDYETVVERFQKIYFGVNGTEGLMYREQWIATDGLLDRLAARHRLAIFTGRTRQEVRPTLDRFAPELVFDPIIAADDVAEGKPSPEGLYKIAVCCPDSALWYVGDTVDDARSAKAAGVPFIGIAAPENPKHDDLVALLTSEGAVAVLNDINSIESVLPQ
ncbi:MAG: HAD-IA family hydrolase [Bryobacteraceae bacterium]